MTRRSPTQTQAKSSFTPAQAGLLQRKCESCGQHTIADNVCTDCQKKMSLQRRAATSAAVSEVPSVVHDVLRQPGQTLDSTTRGLVEPLFGHDFSAVRVHTDAQAAASAQAVNALAYTVGPHVVFGAGQFRPWTNVGQQLLGHELTHVMQQERHEVRGMQRRPPSLEDDDWREREADDMGFRLGRRLGRHSSGSTMSYREALETLPPPRPTPPAAKVQDRRQRVLDSDRPQFEDLRTFLQTLPSRLRALVATGSPDDSWLTASNPNLQSALRVLDGLVADLAAERFVIRFDRPTGTTVAASYDFLNNIMHIAPFTGAERRTSVAIDMLHEYAHILQDREAEAAFAQQATPHGHTREEDLRREIGARREQVYFAELVRVLGLQRPTEEIFGTQLSDMVFRGRFEQERTASTAGARAAATREIRSSIETPYQSQLQTNSSIKTYPIEIDQRNHALLRWDLPGQTSPRDLGEVPQTIAEATALNSHLERLIRGLAEFNTLFNNPGGQRYRILTFFVIYDGRKVTEFGVEVP